MKAYRKTSIIRNTNNRMLNFEVPQYNKPKKSDIVPPQEETLKEYTNENLFDAFPNNPLLGEVAEKAARLIAEENFILSDDAAGQDTLHKELARFIDGVLQGDSPETLPLKEDLESLGDALLELKGGEYNNHIKSTAEKIAHMYAARRIRHTSANTLH